MNINKFRNATIDGIIVSLKAQIVTWNIYAKRTGEDVSTIVSAINTQITSLEALKV